MDGLVDRGIIAMVTDASTSNGWRVVMEVRNPDSYFPAARVTFTLQLFQSSSSLCSVRIQVDDPPVYLGLGTVFAQLAFAPDSGVVGLLNIPGITAYTIYDQSGAQSSVSNSAGSANWLLIRLAVDCSITFAAPQQLTGSFQSLAVDQFGSIYIGGLLYTADGAPADAIPSLVTCTIHTLVLNATPMSNETY